MKRKFQHDLLAYYEAVSTAYVDLIEPVMQPLANGLIDYAALKAGSRVVDLGTASGIAAKAAVRAGCHVTAIDFSPKLAQTAVAQHTPDVLIGDMHHLPVAASTFDVAIGSFSYNSTNPLLALHETYRVLRQHGRIVMQEWGITDPLSKLVNDTLAEYAVEKPSTRLAELRSAQQEIHPWDTLDTSDDIVEILLEAGFIDVEIHVDTVTVCLKNVNTFIDFKMAWPIRNEELSAMSPDIRNLFLSELEENLAAHSEDDGQLIWQPMIVRATGVKVDA